MSYIHNESLDSGDRSRDGWLNILSALAVPIGLYLLSLYNYLLFHSIAEIFSIVIACGIFVIAWNSKAFASNNYLLFVGIAYLFVAGIDLGHTLAYKGMEIFPGGGGDLPTQLWIAARYLESITLLLAPWFLRRRVVSGYVFAGYALASVILLTSAFSGYFPVCYIEGAGLTPFKKISEYGISLILAAALFLLLANKKEFDARVLRLLVFSIVFSIISELAFTFYIGVYDFSNRVGHFFKIVSFYLIYRAIIKTGLIHPYDLIFRDLKRSEESLQKAQRELETRVEERTIELRKSNEWLQAEIAERRRAEEERQRVAEEIRDLYNNAPCGYHSLDKEGVYVRVNDMELSWLGYAREEIVGRKQFAELLTPASLELFRRNYPGFKERGWVRDLEFEMIRKDGTIMPVLLNATSIRDASGEFIMSRSTIFDITEPKRSQGKLKSYMAKLEQSNRDLQDFAFFASHDLQEPLRKIQSFGDLLQSKFGSFSDPQALDYVERMKNAAGRMQELIHALLRYSRVMTKAESFADVNLSLVLKGVVSDLESTIARTGGRIEVGELPTLEAEPIQMGQLFQNLIGNALKYRGEDKPLIKIHGYPLAGPPREERRVQILVEDNGMGFDEQYAERIFAPFQRLHGRGEYEGAGMGLAICRKVVERHGGTITARSTPGKGSTFIITLPEKQLRKD